MITSTIIEETLAALKAERDKTWARYWELVGAVNSTEHWKAVFEAPPPEESTKE